MTTSATTSCAELARLVHEEDNLLTREEAATYAGVSLRTIDYWIRREYLPALRFGRSVRVEFDGLSRLVDERRNSADGRISRTPPGPRPQRDEDSVTITLTAEQVAQVAALLRVVQGVSE